LAWRGFLVTGFERTEGEAVEVAEELGQILIDCYPTLTLPEIARLKRSLFEYVKQPEQIWSSICLHYRLEEDAEMDEVLELLPKTPITFQDWCSQQEISGSDLYPLLKVVQDMEYPTQVFPLLEKISALELDRNEFRKALLLSLRALRSGCDIEALLGDESSSKSSWLMALQGIAGFITVELPKKGERKTSELYKRPSLFWNHETIPASSRRRIQIKREEGATIQDDNSKQDKNWLS
jgi:hypothetical protein